jgi:hypothetical protein
MVLILPHKNTCNIIFEQCKEVSFYFIVMPNNFIICKPHITVGYALETSLKKDRNVPGCKEVYCYELRLLHTSDFILADQ